MNRVIDMWAPFLPLPEVSAHFAEHFPEPMLGYLKVFWKQPATMDTVRQMQSGRTLSEDDVMKTLDDAGIERSLITGFDETSTAGTVTLPNELVAQIAERRPGRRAHGPAAQAPRAAGPSPAPSPPVAGGSGPGPRAGRGRRRWPRRGGRRRG